MKLSIIIPVYNEEKTVAEVIRRVKILKLKASQEIIVVDDGSSDNSWNKINKIKGIKKIRHISNKGKGAAVKSGIEHSSGDIILVQDADMELDPSQIPMLIKPILEKKAEVVYGSRNKFKKDSKRSPIFFMGGHLVTFITNLIYGTKLTDEPCGYKVFKSSIIKGIHLKGERFEWEPEITAKISKMGIKITEIPVRVVSRSIKEGKKLRRIDGVKAVWALIKYRFVD